MTHSHVTWLIRIWAARDTAAYHLSYNTPHTNKPLHLKEHICDMTHLHVTWPFRIWAANNTDAYHMSYKTPHMNKSLHPKEHLWIQYCNTFSREWTCDTKEWVATHVQICHVTQTKSGVLHVNHSRHHMSHKRRHTKKALHSKEHTWISHCARVNESFTMCEASCHTCMRHLTLAVGETFANHVHIYKWVMSLIWTWQVAHMKKLCHTYEWVMSHIWTSHATHSQQMNLLESIIIYRNGLGHVTRMNESWHTQEWVMSHTYDRRDCCRP